MHHVAIAEKFELRRSPCAEVSQAITTVDDYRLLSIENVLSFMEQLRERQVNRTSNRAGAMLVRGENVDDLPTLGNEFQDFAMIDDAQMKEAAILEGSPLANGTTFG